ncbi:MAG: lytic murein transglycosylase [Gammaproteobacteria bacterium]|nr:lytic murein transglycosylase [Gammaproteobacteria bacterium]MBU1653905.1 lytic murein transglycosylase [Gammaproteobacteria bacterium]MBU1962344.1 lytic murein transglycosylase [Gammaproteobacteria bacterium]
MTRSTKLFAPGAALALLLGLAGNALADGCNNTPFADWLQEVKREAAAKGISPAVIQNLDGLTYDPKVIAMDRKQGVFAQTFLTFAGRMANNYRLTHGQKYMQEYAGLFSKLEAEFGVPAPVVVAFWSLETDFGANTGSFDTLRSLATLAHDCRRPEKFRPQLISALEVIEKGYLTPAEMKGAWAGELGQTQFLPSDYIENGVDGDNDGRVDLLKSKPDVLASTSKLVASFGWRRGEPWLEEVAVPASLPWEKADLKVMLPRSTWSQWGVTKVGGGALPADNLEASLLLPMGKNGPAFLAYQNFRVYTEWNKSLVYCTTAAYMATRMAGAPAMSSGRAPIEVLSLDDIKQVQQILQSKGYDVGKIDGILGEGSRAAVREEQLKLGMPADSYPTKEFLIRMGGTPTPTAVAPASAKPAPASQETAPVPSAAPAPKKAKSILDL